jgi:hypothetical protein
LFAWKEKTMSLSWLQRWSKSKFPINGQARRTKRRVSAASCSPCRSRSTVRLKLEHLEDRRVLSSPDNVQLLLFGAQGPYTSGGSIASYAGVGFQRNDVAYLLTSVNGAPDTNKSDFHAQINWGDSHSSTGDLVYEGLYNSSYAEYLIKGTHTYQQANPNNGYSVSVTVNGPDGTSDGPQQTAKAYVNDMPSGMPGMGPTLPVNLPDAENVQLLLFGAQGPYTSGGSITSYDGVGFQRNDVAYLLASVNGAPDQTLSDFTAQINYGNVADWWLGDLVYEGLYNSSYAEYLIKGSFTYQQHGIYANALTLNGEHLIQGKQAYQQAKTNNGYPIVVYVNGPDGTSISGQTATGYVADMPSGIPGRQPTLPANPHAAENVQLLLFGAQGPYTSGGSIDSIAGVGFQENDVAWLLASVNGAPDQTLSDFTAQINYGDSASWYNGDPVYEGLYNNSYAEYLIKGTHTYQQATPPNAGSPIVVYVNGPDGTSTSGQTATGNVSPNPIPTRITLSPTTILAGTVDTAYNQTITASGGNGDPTVSYYVTSGAILTGLSFNVLNGNALTISGIPQVSGSVSFSVTAIDSAGDSPVTQTYTLTVYPAEHPVTLSPAAPTSPAAPPSPPAPKSLQVPPLLELLDSLLGGIETINGNGTETITDSFFGIPLLVATFDQPGNLESVTLFWINITFLFA